MRLFEAWPRDTIRLNPRQDAGKGASTQHIVTQDDIPVCRAGDVMGQINRLCVTQARRAMDGRANRVGGLTSIVHHHHHTFGFVRVDRFDQGAGVLLPPVDPDDQRGDLHTATFAAWSPLPFTATTFPRCRTALVTTPVCGGGGGSAMPWLSSALVGGASCASCATKGRQ